MQQDLPNRSPGYILNPIMFKTRLHRKKLRSHNLPGVKAQHSQSSEYLTDARQVMMISGLQVLRRSTQQVWASPSHRRMDSKSESEEMTYPFVCFTVDNFDEAFSDIQVLPLREAPR